MYQKGSKTVLQGNFNLDFTTQEEDFVKSLRVEALELRTNPKYYATRGHVGR